MQLNLLIAEAPMIEPPADLDALLGLRVSLRPPVEQRLIDTPAMGGRADGSTPARLLPDQNDPAPIGARLEQWGLVRRIGTTFALSHSRLADVVLSRPADVAMRDRYDRAAVVFDRPDVPLEVRAYLALRGQPDMSAFVTAEEAAQLRLARGDD